MRGREGEVRKGGWIGGCKKLGERRATSERPGTQEYCCHSLCVILQ